MTDHQPIVQPGSRVCVCGITEADHALARTYLGRVGWYEFIKGGEATTHIAYVYEDGSVYLPEGPDVVDETDFRLVFGTDRCHRLIREDEVRHPRSGMPVDCCPGNYYASGDRDHASWCHTLKERDTEAPCSGQRSDPDTCFTCGHEITDHNERLVCQLCDVPATFVCAQSDADPEQEAEALAWWRSQQ